MHSGTRPHGKNQSRSTQGRDRLDRRRDLHHATRSVDQTGAATAKGEEFAKDCSRNRHLEIHCGEALCSGKGRLKNEHRLSIPLRYV